MSKRRGIFSIGSLLSAMWELCKRIAARSWQGVSEIVWPRGSGRRNDPFEGVGRINVGRPPVIDVCGECVELKELIRVLTIGDRIRVLCDDGVLVAEKVSQMEFRLVDSRRVSKLVH